MAFLSELINAKMQDFGLDVNDILDENLMPMALVMLEEGDKSDFGNLSLGCPDKDFKCSKKDDIATEKDDGTFNNAFSSMGFHRKMINNFLCSKFIAEQILDDLQPKKMKNRLGVAKSSPKMEFMVNNSLSFNGGRGGRKSHMLFDEGSNEYKNWLAK